MAILQASIDFLGRIDPSLDHALDNIDKTIRSTLAITGAEAGKLVPSKISMTMKAMQTEIDRGHQSMRRLEGTGAGLHGTLNRLDSMTHRYTERIRALQQHKVKLVERMQSATGGTANYERAIKGVTTEIHKNAEKLKVARSAQANLQSELNDANKIYGELGRHVRANEVAQAAFAQNIYDTTRKVTSLGIALVGVQATMAVFGLATIAAARFQYQMAEVATIMETKDIPLLGKLRQGVLDVSVQYGLSAKDTARALYQILSAQIPVEHALNVLRVSAMAARAGFTTLEAAADSITTILKAYQMSASQAERVSDLLFLTVRKGKVEFKDLAPQIGRVAATAASAGMSLEELATLTSILTGAGQRAGITMTGIGAILRDFLRPSVEAQQLAWSDWGIALDETTLRGEGLIRLLERLASANMEQLAVMFPQIRGYRAIAALKMRLGEATKTLAYMQEYEGATAEALARVMPTLRVGFDQLVAAVHEFVIGLGKIAEPLGAVLSELAAGIKGASDLAKESWAGSAAMIGVLVASVAVGVGALSSAITVLSGTLAALHIQTAAVKAAFVEWALIAAAITLVVMAVAELYQWVDRYANRQQQLYQGILELTAANRAHGDTLVALAGQYDELRDKQDKMSRSKAARLQIDMLKEAKELGVDIVDNTGKLLTLEEIHTKYIEKQADDEVMLAHAAQARAEELRESVRNRKDLMGGIFNLHKADQAATRQMAKEAEAADKKARQHLQAAAALKDALVDKTEKEVTAEERIARALETQAELAKGNLKLSEGALNHLKAYNAFLSGRNDLERSLLTLRTKDAGFIKYDMARLELTERLNQLREKAEKLARSPFAGRREVDTLKEVEAIRERELARIEANRDAIIAATNAAHAYANAVKEAEANWEAANKPIRETYSLRESMGFRVSSALKAERSMTEAVEALDRSRLGLLGEAEDLRAKALISDDADAASLVKQADAKERQARSLKDVVDRARVELETAKELAYTLEAIDNRIKSIGVAQQLNNDAIGGTLAILKRTGAVISLEADKFEKVLKHNRELLDISSSIASVEKEIAKLEAQRAIKLTKAERAELDRLKQMRDIFKLTFKYIEAIGPETAALEMGASRFFDAWDRSLMRLGKPEIALAPIVRYEETDYQQQTAELTKEGVGYQQEMVGILRDMLNGPKTATLGG